MIEMLHQKECLVFGCGNPLFGDDGFGPKVMEELESRYLLPGHVACMDVGTSIRDFLFDILLMGKKPKQIIVVDAARKSNRSPGEIFEIEVEDLNHQKISDYSLHQFPTTNMLKEIKDGTDIRVRVLVVQADTIPDVVQPGFSTAVRAAIPKMCEKIMGLVQKENKSC